MPLSDDALRELTGLAGLALGHEDLPTAQAELCRIAQRTVPGAEAASLTSFSESGPTAAAASDAWGAELDELQYVEHEGPCLDAGRSGMLFRVRDMAADPRWPSYLPRAVERGARSMVSVPMNVESKTIGALNVYARVPDAFDAEAVSVAEIVAGHASLASQVAATLFAQRRLGDQLREAMRSRAVIEQAKGVIMATTRCGADEAFELLVKQSQHENRKLRDVAEELVERQAGGPGGPG